MPKIKIDYIVSFSSEDPVHIANNLLVTDPAKKWKCKEPGEKIGTVILQLEKATVISAIDIGNENSAYIEVLVSRSGSSEEYSTLLLMSSFMTALESRQDTNINKVRMFTHDQLNKPENEQKWDRVKIVCSQPYNRHVKFGLSFIILHSPDDNKATVSSDAIFGKFKLNPVTPSDLNPGFSFYKQQQEKEKNKNATVAEAIRVATPSSIIKRKRITIVPNKPSTTSDNSDQNNKLPSRNRDEILYTAEEPAPHKDKGPKKIKLPSRNRDEILYTAEEPAPRKDKAPKKIKLDTRKREKFTSLLKGVIIVISGIVNPARANLRKKAEEMGAKYRAQWDNDCTHLICAFANTPKFNEVKGKGKIVKKEWLDECHRQRKRLPWRRFFLDRDDSKGAESEEEIWELETNQVEEDSDSSTCDEGYDDSKIEEALKKRTANPSVYDHDTDEETNTTLITPKTEEINKLSDFFQEKTFYIDENLPDNVIKTLNRYIISYRGTILENFQNINYCVCSQDYFKGDTQETIFVSPDWVWECHNTQKLADTLDFER